MTTAAQPAPQTPTMIDAPARHTAIPAAGLIILMITMGASVALAGYQLAGADNFHLRAELAKTQQQRDQLQKEKDALSAELQSSYQVNARCSIDVAALSEHTRELEQWQVQARRLMRRGAAMLEVCARYMPGSAPQRLRGEAELPERQ